MRLIYWDSMGFNILETPNGAIFLHLLARDMLIGPLKGVDEASCFAVLAARSGHIPIQRH